MMVLIKLDGNSILVEAMQNQTSGEMIRAYQTLVDRLKECRISPKLHIFDNECSNEFRKQIETNNMKYKVEPHHDIGKILRKKQSKRSRFISLQSCVERMQSPPCSYGAEFYGNQNTS